MVLEEQGCGGLLATVDGLSTEIEGYVFVTDHVSVPIEGSMRFWVSDPVLSLRSAARGLLLT